MGAESSPIRENPSNLIRVMPAKGQGRFPRTRSRPVSISTSSRGARRRRASRGTGACDEQAPLRLRSRHAEGHDRPDRRLAQDPRRAGGGARPACAAARDRAVGGLGRAAAAGLRHLGPLYRRHRRHRRRERACSARASHGCASAAASRSTRAARSSRSTTATSPASTSPARSPTRQSRCALFSPSLQGEGRREAPGWGVAAGKRPIPSPNTNGHAPASSPRR